MNVEWTPHSVYILLFTGLIASAVDFTIWFYLIKKLDINITTFSSMLVPVFGLFFDWLHSRERARLGDGNGGALILVGNFYGIKEMIHHSIGGFSQVHFKSTVEV